jgi:hypothetical protein
VRRSLLSIAAFLTLISLASAARAQEKPLTIDDIFDPAKKVDFGGAPVTGLRWLKDGASYLHSRVDPATKIRTLMRVNALTGEATPFFDAAKMEAASAPKTREGLRIARLI